ncbi:YczE/YyaS/YitT family protein [Natronincola ferrireducens]|uniref:Uncharacterized membrane protein YczE n=1 Tax=Natronincola ferrireducens TaxID=393762 RepID=A0A1G8YF30_9FIRM|nr:hypothetical protein [Natronincola ferrireducens]SDK01267.1 Uncharacterized membrane protein YczE [Natronincola ferrireducens]
MTTETKAQWVKIIKKLPSLFLGCFLFATGTVATLYGGLGMSPWGVFHMGIANHTPFTLGQVTQLLGLIILLIGYKMGRIPGLGTICNMIFVGGFMDLIEKLGVLRVPETLVGKFTMLAFGILISGWGSYFYLRVQLGAGPRDGLMEGLVKKLKKPVWLIRGTMETTVLILGYFLGGPVGIGTVITALTLGFSVQFAFRLGGYSPKKARHINFLEMFKLLSGKDLCKETSY